MEISIPVAAELVSSTLVDETTAYDYQTKQNFPHGENMQDHDKIYQWVKDSFIPPDYAHGDEHGYKVNDILFKDNMVQIVKTMGEKYIPQQPEKYISGFDNTFTFATWSKYFSKIQTGVSENSFNGFTKEVNGITHRLYRDQNSPTGWYYEIVWKAAYNDWGPEKFDSNASDGKVTMIRYTNKPTLALMDNGMSSVVSGITAKPVPNVTEYSGGGNKYRAGHLQKTVATTKAGVREYNATNTFVVPEGITSIHVCMIGGGGAGASCEDINSHTQAGGGKAGEIKSFDLAVHAGQRIPFSVGNGGVGRARGVGGNGAITKFGTTSSAGGVGGQTTSTAYAGNGGSKTNCYGTFKDGVSINSGGSSMYGGEAGFASGGRYWGTGSKGSGGGGAQRVAGGAGGKGYIKISWVAEGGTLAYYYAVQKEIAKQETKREFEEATFYTELNENSIIKSAICFNGNDCNNSWLGKTFVQRGTDLFVRTATGIAELEHITLPTYMVAKSLEDLTASGFVYLEPTIPYKPLDDKAYTAVTTKGGDYTFTIRSDGKFNTLALGSIIAKSIDILFKDADGNQVGDAIIGYEPHNYRDIGLRLPDYQTTTVLYSYDSATDKVIDIAEGGTVEITIKGDYTMLGLAMLGLSVDAGFTNLIFQNEFVDLSPMEKDQWGNIVYVSGVRVNVHSGKVDIPIREYDMMNRLMISIGGSKVILNGSSSIRNSPADSSCIFASTMLIGRMDNIKLTTQMDDKEIGDMATYTFKIIEDV